MAGGNNAGKSTTLHAIAVWEFCRLAILMERGPTGLEPRSLAKQGLGIGDEEFSPINIPSLKHLWTNLKPSHGQAPGDKGYTMKITLRWTRNDSPKHLGFKLALANDRLFLRLHVSNLEPNDATPRIAYLPTFAGINAREERLSGAIRRNRISQGLAGAVLRNVLLDLQIAHSQKEMRLRTINSKLAAPRASRREALTESLNSLRESDPWSRLQDSMREVFACELSVRDFKAEYHSYISVMLHKGSFDESGGFNRHKNASPCDLMVEGNGFLQWFSVLTLALSEETDVLLLDEPDAHLHPALQTELFNRLQFIAETDRKQILIATHSSEILRNSDPKNILAFKKGKSPKFLVDDTQKAALLSGIGSIFLPKIDRIKETGCIFFHEGTSDIKILSIFAKTMGLTINPKWIGWQTTEHHKERRLIFRALQEEIGSITSISLRDRDNLSPESIDENLLNRSEKPLHGFDSLNWKHRHIESYLVVPSAIALAKRMAAEDVISSLAENHNFIYNNNYGLHAGSHVVLDIRGKEILAELGVKAADVAKNIDLDAIPDDIVTLVKRLSEI